MIAILQPALDKSGQFPVKVDLFKLWGALFRQAKKIVYGAVKVPWLFDDVLEYLFLNLLWLVALGQILGRTADNA